MPKADTVKPKSSVLKHTLVSEGTAMHRTSVERFARERDILQSIEDTCFDLDVLNSLSGVALEDHLHQAIEQIKPLRHPRILEELFAMGAMHPDPEIRKLCLRHAASLAKVERSARELIVWLLGDSEDHVLFEAIRLAGRERIGEAVGDLMSISGPASLGMVANSRPVGVGAALVLRSLTQIFGTTDPNRLKRLEEEYTRDGSLPPGTLFDDMALYQGSSLPDVPGMTRIPAGEYITGIDPDDLPEFRFDCSDVIPRSTVYLPEFLIDTFPVTNAAYDAWAESDAAQAHILCHPDEPDNKDHRRGTRRDPRCKPDHPVSGVDWFDAYAYCAHHGKELPSEFEWEKAARGTDGRLFPWGNEWNSEAVQWAEKVFDQRIDSIQAWRKLLQEHNEHYPALLTVSVQAHPAGRSPYGVAGMIGNTWEWTRTNFFTRQPMNPRTKGRPRPEWITAPESFAVIRGGAWSSIGEVLSTFFRGRDLFSDRHNEIGFRGVIR